MKTASQSDWTTHPLPEARATIALDRSFSPAEMERIEAGLVPEEMEDKWFVYFDSDRLNFHRSWTGFCIYMVEFVRDRPGGRMVQALVNRNPEQYSNSSDDHDRKMISFLIDALLLRRPAEYPASNRSSEESAIEQWSVVGRAMLGDHPGPSASEHVSSPPSQDEHHA